MTSKPIRPRNNNLAFFSTALAIILINCMDHQPQKPAYTYLALGDSYTIGEGLPSSDNYPSRTVAMLNADGMGFKSPRVIAETGWTTTDLQTAIDRSSIRPTYDFVTLLIGVNNQYRNMDVEGFGHDFESLLKQAIRFASNKPAHVAVLSIPDWSVTTYAHNYLPDNAGRDAQQVSTQIDAYNAVCRRIAGEHHVSFIDITPSTRKAADQPSLLAADGLHPSAIEYELWAEKLSKLIKSKL